MKGNTCLKFLAYFTLFSAAFREVHCCEHGWQHFSKFCVRVFHERKTFVDARDYCRKDGNLLFSFWNKPLLLYLAEQLQHDNDYYFWTTYYNFPDHRIKSSDDTIVIKLIHPTHELCHKFHPRAKKVTRAECDVPLKFICVHPEVRASIKACNGKVNTESFIGEDTGNCLFEAPGETTKGKVEELCTKYEGHFVDLDGILKDGIKYFYNDQVLANNRSRYWTNITWKGTNPIWNNPLKDDIYANKVFFTNGSGSCTTMEFYITKMMNILEIHLHKMECDSKAKVVCSKPNNSSATEMLHTESTREFYSVVEGSATDTTMQERSEFSTNLKMFQTEKPFLETIKFDTIRKDASEFSSTTEVPATDTNMKEPSQFTTILEMSQTETTMQGRSEVSSNFEMPKIRTTPEASKSSAIFEESQTATAVQEDNNYSTTKKVSQTEKTKQGISEFPNTTEKATVNCFHGFYYTNNRTTTNCFRNASLEVEFSSWEDGEEYCRSVRRGHLPSFHSKREEVFGLNFMAEGLPGPYWIGLKLDPEYGTYRWSDGTPLDYSNWAPGHPDHKDKRLRCVAMETKDKQWVSANCRAPIYFICKISYPSKLSKFAVSTTVPVPLTSEDSRSVNQVEELAHGLSTRTLLGIIIGTSVSLLMVLSAVIYFRKRWAGRREFCPPVLHRSVSFQNIVYKVMSDDMEFGDQKDLL